VANTSAVPSAGRPTIAPNPYRGPGCRHARDLGAGCAARRIGHDRCGNAHSNPRRADRPVWWPDVSPSIPPDRARN
jgi:hypothetical protein